MPAETPADTGNSDDVVGSPTGRRAFLIGTGAAIAWTAPIITAVPAAAQTTATVSPPFVASTNASGTTNTLTPALPPGTQDGDLILAIASLPQGRTATPPSGWSVPAGPGTSTGSPSGDRVTSYLFAYTGPSASTALTSFVRAGTAGATWRLALATFEPGAGGSGVNLDGSSMSQNGDGVTPPFPNVNVNGLRTVVYLGATGNQGSGLWQSTPGASTALGSIASGYDLAISYTLDVSASPGVTTGALVGPGGGATTDTVTFTVALATT